MKRKRESITMRELIFAVGGGVLMLLFLFIDQFTKMITDYLGVHQSKFFLGIICIDITRNPGMAFSWFADKPSIMVMITVLTVFLIIGIGFAYFFLFRKNKPAQICLAIIEAGAIGNLIDRLVLGCVRDFIDVSPLHFGVCNPADFFITFGAVALVFIILFIGPSAVFPLTKKWREEAKRLEEEKKHQKKRNAAEDKHGASAAETYAAEQGNQTEAEGRGERDRVGK